MLTERQLWLRLAELWAVAKPYTGEKLTNKPHHIQPFPGDVAVPGQEPCFGLCRSIVRFQSKHAITQEVFASAERRLNEYLKKRQWNKAYLFPINAEGAQLRAAACRELADQVDPIPA